MAPTLRLDSGYNVYGTKRPKLNYPPGALPPDGLAAPDPTATLAGAAPAATAAPATALAHDQTLTQDPAQPQSLIRPRSLSPAVQGLADSYLGKLNAAPVTADQVMGSREYQERVKPIDLAAGEAQADITGSLASRGMLRSTPAIQALASSGAYYAAQKGAMASNLIDSAQARQQQSLGNARSAMGDMANLDNTAFNQGVTQFQTTAPYTMLTKGQQQDTAFREADFTGRYLSPAAKGLAETILKAKGNNAIGQDPAAAQQANDARNQLSAMGYDAGLLGSDVTMDQARQNMSKLGMQSPDMAFKEASVTGRYLPPGVRDLYNQVLQLKQQNTGGQNPGAAQQADALRGQIAAAGYDPSLVGSDVALTDAQQNMGMAGAQTPQARAAALQEQRSAVALDMERLQAQIEQNPDVGAMAQARVAMQTKQKQLNLMDAQIKQANAKALSGGGNGLTAWQLYQIERDKKSDGEKTAATTEKAAAAREKAREKLVDSFRSDYTVSQPGAEMWTEFMDIATTPKADGSTATRDELDKLLGDFLKTPNITNDDIGWARAMFWAGQGDQGAQGTLNTKYRKKPID